MSLGEKCCLGQVCRAGMRTLGPAAFVWPHPTSPCLGEQPAGMTADPTLESGWFCELIHTELPDVCLPQGWLEATRTCWVCESSHPSADSRLKYSAVGDGEVFPLVFGPQDPPPQPLPTSLSFLIQVGTRVGTEQVLGSGPLFWERSPSHSNLLKTKAGPRDRHFRTIARAAAGLCEPPVVMRHPE